MLDRHAKNADFPVKIRAIEFHNIQPEVGYVIRCSRKGMGKGYFKEWERAKGIT